MSIDGHFLQAILHTCTVHVDGSTIITVVCTCTNEHLLHVHVDGSTIITVVCTFTCTTCTCIIVL